VTLAELRNYNTWAGKTAAAVLRAVMNNGGWVNVFPTSLPRWASRIRNYFNILPKWLQREKEADASSLITKYRTNTSFKSRHALSGDVYRDDGKRPWFEMHKIGASYHYPGGMPLNVVKGAFLPQSFIPIFKLISPDGSGGSLELIIDNPKSGWIKRSSSIGEPGELVNIEKRIVTDDIYQATYNYSETIVMGLPAHELRDVQPHNATPGFYINPPDQGSALMTRVFPEKDPLGKVLAEQN
jgi:hypothetical protein